MVLHSLHTHTDPLHDIHVSVLQNTAAIAVINFAYDTVLSISALGYENYLPLYAISSWHGIIKWKTCIIMALPLKGALQIKNIYIFFSKRF